MPLMTEPDEVRFQTIVFLRAVVPVLKPIIQETPALTAAFSGLTGVVQISALTGEDDSPDAQSVDGRKKRTAVHLIVDNGEITVTLGAHRAPNVELQFPSRTALNGFFLGKITPTGLPAIRGGLSNPKLLVATVRALLTMSKILGATEPPASEQEQALLVRCMFYLLTTGISQLNKAGHPTVKKWAAHQPDRAYQLTVSGWEELDAYIRVKNGRTKAARGTYTRSTPFFAMQFDSLRSALGTLLSIDDMVEATTQEKIVMSGSPEYGAELGDLMFLVGDYAK